MNRRVSLAASALIASLLFGCSTSKQKTSRATSAAAAQSSPGAELLFEKFSGCGKEVFQTLADHWSVYQTYGPLKQVKYGGAWFDTKPPGSNPHVTIHRFSAPIRINGATVVAAGYSFFKGTPDYSGDATYWGFYFAESAKEVFAALKGKYPAVATMQAVGGDYVNLKTVEEGDRTFVLSGLIETETAVPGAKSYFNCSIQYKN